MIRGSILILSGLICASWSGNYFPPDSFTDERDGYAYPLISVGSDVWIGEDLKFRSEGVSIKETKEGGLYYYYPLEERDKVCPNPFHLVTKLELDNAFETVYGLSADSVDTISYQPPLFLQYLDFDNHFMADSGLYFEPSGWFQGKRHKKMKTLSMWVDYENDDRYHLHLGDVNGFFHAHDHNIVDKKRKKRKLAVRCVCEQDRLKEYLDSLSLSP